MEVLLISSVLAKFFLFFLNLCLRDAEEGLLVESVCREAELRGQAPLTLNFAAIVKIDVRWDLQEAFRFG